MADAVITIDQLSSWVRRFNDLVIKNQAELTELDSAIGDADHGINMARGMSAVINKLAGDHPAHVNELFKTVAMTLVTSVGGASGPLYGTFFLRFAGAAGPATELDAEALDMALRAGLSGIVERGKAATGDKTMVDALSPALDAMETVIKNGGDLVAAVVAARDAAAAGRDGTVPLVARKGRASYLGERSAGHMDPGAASMSLLFDALSTELAPLSQMVGIVVVSHSPRLAHAAVELALEMVHGPAPRIEIAAGASDDRLGTDAVRVAEAIVAADDGAGVVVIMDLGSAVLSAELAVDLVPDAGIKTRLVSAAFVEGIFAAVVTAAGGAALDVVARDAEEALYAKSTQLGRTQTSTANAVSDLSAGAIVAEATIINPDGIHARPAALVVGALASLDAQVMIATETSRPVSARSPTALMSLGAQAGDVIRIEADGAAATTAVDRILALVRDGFGELTGVHPLKTQQSGGLGWQDFQSPDPIGVSPGRVIGPALQMADPVPEPDPSTRLPEADRPAAVERLGKAAADVASQLRDRSSAAGAVGELLEATAVLATDPELIADATGRVRDRGLTPERAVWEAIGVTAESIRTAGARQALRVSDLYDVRDRIISSLIGRAAPGVADPGHPYVLLAVDLAPANAAGLDATHCLGIATEEGGPTSHTAIIARSLGIPAVVGAHGLTTILDGTLVLLDGSTGELIIEPSVDQQAAGGNVQPPPRERLTRPGSTSDGHRIVLLANIGSSSDAALALDCGAEGVGLYRTELGFLDRTDPPSVAEQVTTYRKVFATFAGRRVVVRTLDAGSDKALPFLGQSAEANPALGVRGYRIAESHPQLLHDQLMAIKEATATELAEIWVMAPMISTVAETRSFVETARGIGLPIIGVMIETPAAALQTELILAEVDFVSIGTNDLAQYAFAADRHSAPLAAMNDPWQPALLRMIEMVTSAAVRSNKPVGVCGEAAADPLLAPILAGLGVSSLSMTPRALAEVGRSLAALTIEQCRRAARAACDADSPAHAREAVRRVAGFDKLSPR